MIELTPNEARALGVLIEKAQTTPQQYPLSLNALTAGCNQKNNREPVVDLSEERVLEALDGLRNKSLVREVMLSGSRVQKFRHVAREALDVGTSELVILAELMLRGPQTMGELRGRAARMHPLESTEIVKNILDALIARPEPLVKELPPAPGDRAARYMQLLCPNLHPVGDSAMTRQFESLSNAPSDLSERVAQLEQEVADLRQTVRDLAAALGESVAARPN